MLTSMSLVDGGREMVLYPRDGLRVQGLDVPFPAVREVTEDRTDDDGEDDTTQLYGATSCSIDLLATQTPAGFQEELGRFLHPSSRPYLVVGDDEWAQTRRLRLRVSQFSGPRGIDLHPTQRKMQAQWKVPDGVWEAADLSSATVNADVSSHAGVTSPVTLPVSLAATYSAGLVMVSNTGGTPAHMVARLYGPVTAPVLRNDTYNSEIRFTSGLTLGSGEFVEVNTRNRTAYLNSDTSLSLLSYVDFTSTSWWQVQPGDQYVRYAPFSVSGASAAVIEFRSAWTT